jgi:serine/threonine-protein kinase SRPK3
VAEEPEDASDLASVTAGADDTALATDSGTAGAADGEVRTKGRIGQAAESASKGRAGAYAGGRLEVLHTLGVGGFGTVYAAEDVASRALVALKVQRAGRVRSRLALDEIRLLERVARHQAEAAKERAGGGACGGVGGERGTAEWGQRVVALRSSFLESKGAAAQVCIETELLGPNLLDLIKDFRYQGCPLSLVKAVARAALEGLAFLHGRCRVIHTDIKPENILLTLAPRAGVEPLEAAVWWTRHSPSGCKKCKEKAEDARGLACEARWKLRKGWTAVLAEGAPGGAAWGRVGAKLVDLGNACVQDKHFTEDIQTVEYRSPEVGHVARQPSDELVT